MSKKRAFFGGKEEPVKESRQDREKAAIRILLSSGRRSIRAAEKILLSTHALYSDNSFPLDVSNSEKEVLKKSLIALSQRKKQVERAIESLGALSPQALKEVQKRKREVHEEYKEMIKMIDEKISDELNPVLQEKTEVQDNLRTFTEKYLEMKAKLIERKNELIEKSKELKSRKSLKHRAAKNARSHSLTELDFNPEKMITSRSILESDKVIEGIKTDLVKVKGNLTSIFPSREDQKQLQEIIKGERITSYRNEKRNKILEELPKIEEYLITPNQVLPDSIPISHLEEQPLELKENHEEIIKKPS